MTKYLTKNGWTKEKMIQRIKERLPKDGSACVAINGNCCYQNAQGYNCAVGAFIPKNHPAMCLEGSASLVVDNYPELASQMPVELGALNLMQAVHDFEIDRGPQYRHDSAIDRVVAWIRDNVEDACAA